MKKKIYFWETHKIHSVSYFRKRMDFIINNKIEVIPSKKHNKFFGEICPTIALAEKLKAKSVQFTKENDPYDAKIIFPKKEEQIVECTCVKNGHYESKQMEHLCKHHVVSLTIPPELLNLKNKKDWPLTFEELLKNAIQKKEKKGKKNNEYKGAILLLVVSSNFIYGKYTRENLIQQLQSIQYKKGIFKEIYLVPENPLKTDEIFIQIPEQESNTLFL